MNKNHRGLIAFCLLIFWGSTVIVGQSLRSLNLNKKANKRLENWQNVFYEWEHLGKVSIDSIKVEESIKEIDVYFSENLAYMPVRETSIDVLSASLKTKLRKKFKDYTLNVYTGAYEYSELVPNIYRDSLAICGKRTLPPKVKAGNLVQRVDDNKYSKGLSSNHLALWHSHGWYYESKLDRWEWQRARLYGTVEDIFPMTYVLPYLVPMLENAGANVFLPRERDFQKHEVIVDNDGCTGNSEFYLHSNNEPIPKEGFAWRDTLFSGDNPFKIGNSQTLRLDEEQIVASYLPEFPVSGEYAVYVSYHQSEENSDAVEYKVNHTGGSTSYIVDQTMGGGTWVYLGTYSFNKGIDSLQGSVEVFGMDQVSLDAIRFGGGMGNVARRPSDKLKANEWSLAGTNAVSNDIEVSPDDYSWKTSKRPRYMEAARYWMQYAGMPDSLVYSLNEEKNDYNDDYQSRGEWVNYLKDGLNIPIDLAFAFHTDAGVTPNDSIIGTLGIYSSVRDGGVFSNGQSKLANRDLCDVVQSEIVNDIRHLFNENWTRRAMWDKQYSEAWRPDVPTMLLELLSHQNLADMRYGLDPRFRFAVSRSIYKGILKFQAFQEARSYVVQPLPVDHMAIEKHENEFVLSWHAVVDSLEPSARATRYKVYKRIGNNGFDNGTVVSDSFYRFSQPEQGEIVSFKVSALNDGGESFPSEILSMGIGEKVDEFVLVVNAFDRVAGPAKIDAKEMAGLASWKDEGVADKFNFGFTGQQYDFDRNSPWLDDDSPGWGASYGDQEGKIIPGNTFDFTAIHGDALMAAGYSFVSMSDEVFNQTKTTLSVYKAIDIVLGEEKTTQGYKDEDKVGFKIYTPEFMSKLKHACENRIPLIMSGAHVGSDMVENMDSVAIQFTADYLHFKWRTNHAVRTGGVYSTDYAKGDFQTEFKFNTHYNPNIYKVEAPDAIEPVEGGITAFRYGENNSSAGVLYKGKHCSLTLGFPFETIIDVKQRRELMRQIVACLLNEDYNLEVGRNNDEDE
ncbi:hypothetical protein [Carboxylicivirga sp. N1Y90]|uniref:golvesin C-terminal-like domain-containing protein n=1 Tax=Carboxylicivirga fragile TaxID=3417571 RepID=UPI003D3392BF|nr:hypothetical protein [Marinilabiliaceae bacterium N1Y90]